MATGIVSIAAADHGMDVVSAALAVVAVVALAVLIVASALAWKRESWHLRDLDTAMGLFAFVAACAVLAARFAEHDYPVWVLGGLALLGWVSLAPLVTTTMWRIGWTGLRDRAHGGWELASVATSGLAIVSVAAGTVSWSLIFWCLALCTYCLMTALIVWRAVHEPEARRSFPPDHWILMGGLAVATLAGDHIHEALQPGPLAHAVRIVTIETWVLASLWIVPLTWRGWRSVGDWPAVFPLGMYSSATCAMELETGWGWLGLVSLPFFWIAFALWGLTAVRRSLAGQSR